MLYSNRKLHVSAYNGHRQVSIPIKGSVYIWVGRCWCTDLYPSIPCCSII